MSAEYLVTIELENPIYVIECDSMDEANKIAKEIAQQQVWDNLDVLSTKVVQRGTK